MTVTAAEARLEYAGNGATTIFAYPYQFYEANDLEVWLFNDTTGVGVKQILGNDYTVTGVLNPTGGTVVMVIPPPAGQTLTIINSPDIIQLTHYVNADDFPADSHEQALDRLTKICQRLDDRISRAVRAPDYTPEDQVPDADTLVGLVEDAQDAATASANSASGAAASANSAQASQAAATNAALNASTSATNAATSATNAANSASAAAASAAAANVAKMVWLGAWVNTTAYRPNDVVSRNGSSWISKTNNTNKDPSSNPADWDLVAQKGADGTGGGGGGIPEAPNDGQNYARNSLGWNNINAVFATVASPVFTGNPQAPTPPVNDNDTSIATTAFVTAADTVLKNYVDFQDSSVLSQVATSYAPLASPTFTGDPKAPTPATADNDTSIATTAFVKAQGYAPLASPVFTGNPQAPTPTAGDNDTSIATTAFVQAALVASGLPAKWQVATFPNENIYHGGFYASGFSTVIMADGTVRTGGQAWASNSDYTNPTFGAVSVPDLRRVNLPAGLLGTPQKIVQGKDSLFIITDQGDVCCTGFNSAGELGFGNTTAIQNGILTLLNATNIGPRSPSGASRAITDIAVAQTENAARTTQTTVYYRCADGTLWAAGYNGGGQCAQGNTTTPQTSIVQCKKESAALIADCAKVVTFGASTNGQSTVYIDTSGKVRTCGLMASGSNGRNNGTGNQTAFLPVFTTTDVGTSDLPAAYQAIDALVLFSTLAILCADKNIYCSGSGTSGQIGNGSSTNQNICKKVAGASVQGFAERIFGLYHRDDMNGSNFMVQVTSGACFVWGANQNNATPQTTTANGTIINSPVACIAPFTAGCANISKIVCGTTLSTNPSSKMAAILANNTIYSWGGFRFDGTGKIDYAASNTPIQVQLPTRPAGSSNTVSKIVGTSYQPGGGTNYGTGIGILWSDGYVTGIDRFSAPSGILFDSSNVPILAGPNSGTWTEWVVTQR